MDYLTPQEAAEKWGIGLRRVQFFCSEERIPGAVRIGRQWFIPADAEKPVDGRTLGAKQAENKGAYRFPLFFFSEYYASPSRLTEDENTLLQAQILTAKCDLSGSLESCRRLIKESSSVSVRFGAYATCTYNYTLLGMYSEVAYCMAEMEKIRAADPLHDEDYKLLISACKFEFCLDSDDLKKIDANKLSPDAVITYQCAVIVASAFSNHMESASAIKVYSAFAKKLESIGVVPAQIAIYADLVLLYGRAGDEDAVVRYIENVCRLCVETGFLLLLSKYTSIRSDVYQRYLTDHYGQYFADRIEKQHLKNVNSWRVIFTASRGVNIFPDNTTAENELMLLLSFDLTNAEISVYTKRSTSEINAEIKKLCKQYGLGTKAELVRHSKFLFKNIDT